MKILITRNTGIRGEFVKAGDILEVDDATARELFASHKAIQYEVPPLEVENKKIIARKTKES